MLDDFFIDNMLESAEEQEIYLSDDINIYLSKLLSSLSSSEDSLYDESVILADIYMGVLIAKEIGEKVRLMKSIGNTSVIKLGLFPESIKKSLSPSYYRDMGIMSYSYVYEKINIGVYEELSNSYDSCVNVINGVRHLSIKNDIIKLYEAWKSTDSNFAKIRLIKLGMVVGEEGCA